MLSFCLQVLLARKRVFFMANRRMTSRHITSTVQFTSMSAGARALYLHLMDESDDDGIAVGAMIIRMANLRNRDLDTLIENGYVIPLEGTPKKERIVYITHWHECNVYKYPIVASKYRENLLLTLPDSKNRLFKLKTDPSQPTDTGKDKTDREIGKDKASEAKPGEVRKRGDARGGKPLTSNDPDDYDPDELPFKD